MKKLLLAGVAALFLVTGTAHADTLPPTHPLIGSWCEVKGSTLLKRGSCDTAISQTGYSGVEEVCTFFEIKRIRNGIEASAECYGESLRIPYRCENVTLQIIGGRLKINAITPREVKPVDTGDTHRTVCLGIQPTPDGFLNLRRGPGMKYPVIAKLVPGQQRIMVDYQTNEWIHMRSICRAADEQQQFSGWVYKKYIEGLCPNEGFDGSCEP